MNASFKRKYKSAYMEKNKLFGRQQTDRREVRGRECVMERGGCKSRRETKEGGHQTTGGVWCLPLGRLIAKSGPVASVLHQTM